MFRLIGKFFTDADFFVACMGSLAPNGSAILRFSIALLALLSHQGVIPGGDSSAGSWATMIGMVIPFLIPSGDKNLTPAQMMEEIQKNLRSSPPAGKLVPTIAGAEVKAEEAGAAKP